MRRSDIDRWRLATRRHLLGRQFNHKGIKAAFRLIDGRLVGQAVVEFMRFPASSIGPMPVPLFARDMAVVFVESQSKRHAADYDLVETFTELQARATIDEVRRVIDDWSGASTRADRAFKSGLYALMLVGGKLRSE